ncbi:alpha-crystallin domain-containing protein 22.3-like [Chenopodium quinoa]|uniref:alpha-crystallin domain-containing protein 22.3-like n=1 Tax=Chenopodium quinoa TaxID=63459 RepID=UPI000B78C27A|nr:alpha-crystallin domain-containing protein 22.3-like [Chenopodium quinoa]
MAFNFNRAPLQPALNVTPLNSMPYIDPIPPQGSDIPLGPVDKAKPALVYLPSEPTEEEWGPILSATKGGIGLGGSAALGPIGPVLGKLDISESEDSYLFRVSLPGVAKDDFSCTMDPTGHVTIKGVTTTGEKTVYKNSLKFEMQSQNLCPPGHFTVSFNLPGPVASVHLSGHYGIDGVFEGIVKKKKPSA